MPHNPDDIGVNINDYLGALGRYNQQFGGNQATRLYLQRLLLVMLTRIHRLKKHILSILKGQNRRGHLKGEVS